jgi:hypothetical protein
LLLLLSDIWLEKYIRSKKKTGEADWMDRVHISSANRHIFESKIRNIFAHNCNIFTVSISFLFILLSLNFKFNVSFFEKKSHIFV